jgi:hypothetical protein
MGMGTSQLFPHDEERQRRGRQQGAQTSPSREEGKVRRVLEARVGVRFIMIEASGGSGTRWVSHVNAEQVVDMLVSPLSS